MNHAVAELPDTGDAPPEDLVCVGSYRDSAAGFEHSLVVLAMGRPCWLVPVDGSSRLLVERAFGRVATEELARYDRESVGWPPAPPSPDVATGRHTHLATALWATLLLAAFWSQARWPAVVELGALDAPGVFGRGEWWRPFTALFLHGDSGHLLANLGTGILTFLAVGSTFGSGRGWLLLFIAAVAGNTLAAALRLPGPYQSVGASTAVFAGLGLLVGRAATVGRRSGGARAWRPVFVPLGVGAILFALHGAGGPRVDLGAHVAGFVAGLVGGALAGAWPAHARPAGPG